MNQEINEIKTEEEMVEVLETLEVTELEQRYEYVDVTICSYTIYF